MAFLTQDLQLSGGVGVIVHHAVQLARHGFEVDLYWPAQRLVVEYDGWDTHSSRPAFESDRLKDAALQLAGERVLRVTGRQLERRPEERVARFATGLAAAR